MHMLKLLKVFMACVPICMLCGCWSKIEVNDRAFARVMLLDRTDDGIEMTLGFPLPNRLASTSKGGGGGSSSKPFTFVTKTGRDIGEAFQKIQADLTRRVTLGQLRHIVIGKEFAQSGLKPVVDFAARDFAIHINAYLFISEDKAKRLTSIPITFEEFPTDILSQFAKERQTIMVTVRDMLMSTYNHGDLVVPMLVFGRQGVQSEENKENWMGTDGAGVIRNGKMIGKFTNEETQGALWVLKQLNYSAYEVNSPRDNKPINFLIRNASTHLKAQVHGDDISIQIECKAMAGILGTESDINVTEPTELRKLELLLNEEIKDRIRRAVAVSKTLKSDVFQFADYIKWRYPGRWKELGPAWGELYADQVRVDPKVNISVKWFGTSQRPQWNRTLPDAEEHK
ncbi:spore germination protein GerBC [Paenibacillus illinoisensis]|uniref:Ger(x)C family spore germination protein n=1 Tax=Paenibacillus illinoisensis TaxID=59845 RepID=UPI0034B54FEC